MENVMHNNSNIQHSLVCISHSFLAHRILLIEKIRESFESQHAFFSIYKSELFN